MFALRSAPGAAVVTIVATSATSLTLILGALTTRESLVNYHGKQLLKSYLTPRQAHKGAFHI
jgi:hypothetical protein